MCLKHNLLPQASAILLLQLVASSSHAYHFSGLSFILGKIDMGTYTIFQVVPVSVEQAKPNNLPNETCAPHFSACN